MNKFSKKFHKGFTLMEVMVSVSIFAIIVTVGIVSLLTINNAYRKSQAQQQAMDSLTYILESMSRRIRTAQKWTLNSPDSLTILDQDNITVTYSWDGQSEILMAVDNSTCMPQPACVTSANVQSSPAGDPYNLTPANVFISTTEPDGMPVPGGGLSFKMFGGAGTVQQSYLQINLGGYSTDARQTSDFAFQTSVSKRTLDQ